MKRLTPAAVTLMTVVIVSLLVTAYFAKVLLAEEPKARLFDAAQAPSATESRHRLTDAPKTPAVELREIPMALGTLDPGTQVTAALLGTGRVRVDSLQPETLLSERALIGRFVKQPIQAGTPIRSNQLYQPGERPPLEVAPGMRAVSITFSHRGSFVGGLLRKREYVDVYLTPRTSESSDSQVQGGITITLLNGVRVLAVGDAKGAETSSSGSLNTVTLELTPEQANILILAREKGEIALSYNPDGKGMTGGVAAKNSERATMAEILGLEKAESPTPAAHDNRAPFTSEFFKGTKRSTLEFENRND